MSKKIKNSGKLMKIANIDIDRELPHIFWTTWRNSMKFSGKMCFKIMLKFIKNQGFTHPLEDTFFEKPQEGVKLPPPPTPHSPAILGVKFVYMSA